MIHVEEILRADGYLATPRSDYVFVEVGLVTPVNFEGIIGVEQIDIESVACQCSFVSQCTT